MPKQSNPSTNQTERRFLTQEFRVSADSSPKISGYAAVFDSPSEDLGWFTEEIDPKAFDTVMANGPDCRALWNHNPDVILGRTKSGTLTLSVDARGLAYSIDPPDTQAARDLIVSMKRGDISQSSFGFRVSRDQWTDNPDGTVSRRILEVAELVDVSPVCYPAYAATSSSVRSIPDSCPVEIRSRFEKRDDPDADPSCSCDCGQCQAGSCSLCSDSDCDDEYCSSCPMGEENRNWRLNTELRLRMLRKV